MASRERFLTCPSCARHVKQAETCCPHCGGALRRADGSTQRTPAAVLLGLTAALGTVGILGCAYGMPPTGSGGAGTGATGATGGSATTSTGGGGTTTTATGGGAGGTTTAGGGGSGGTATTGGGGSAGSGGN